MALLRFGLMSLLLALLAVPALAQPTGPGPHVRSRLVAETDLPAAGSDVTLAIVSTPDSGWHAYWQNPGDAGLPAKAEWTLPQGITADELRYPVPQRLLIAGLMNYVYESTFVRLVTLHIPAGAKGTLPIALKLDYLVCTDSLCVPEKAELSTVLTIGDGAPMRRADFDGWRAALPKPIGTQATYQAQDGRIRIAVPFPASAEAGKGYFYPLTTGSFDYAAPQTVTRDGDRIVIEAKGKDAPKEIEGLLALGKQGFLITAVAGTVAPASGAPMAEGAPGLTAALLAFAGAVLGGLILNIMPCVFPILSLKALSLAKANDGEGNPRGEALAYTAGVVLVCLALGGVLLALRTTGASLGWGFQLQDPRAILLLLLLVSAIAFNLAGLFEIGAPGFVNRAAAKGTSGAFATGALAAFVATPCAGPFMASALGAALVLPWPAALAVFGGLGLGIALPFLLLGFVPAFRRLLPKPGAWMATMRRILSVPMFLTALALAWVLGKLAGVDGMAIGLGATLLAMLGLWWAGLRQLRGRSFAWAPAILLILPAAAAIAYVRPAQRQAEAKQDGVEPFTEARLAELTAQGRPVFAYFTADWCLTCKVNEKAVIETATVSDSLKRGKVTVLVGDWTDGDAALGRFIERHNRAGVPLYLWYKPGAPEPQILPQILTQDLITRLAKGD